MCMRARVRTCVCVCVCVCVVVAVAVVVLLLLLLLKCYEQSQRKWTSIKKLYSRLLEFLFLLISRCLAITPKDFLIFWF